MALNFARPGRFAPAGRRWRDFTPTRTFPAKVSVAGITCVFNYLQLSRATC